MAQKAPKVIKVVNLKRFRPDTFETTPKLKRAQWSTAFNRESSNKNRQDDNTNLKTPCMLGNEHLSQTTIEKSTEEQHFVDPSANISFISSRSKIKFRNCTHSPDELSTLHEHTDETLVKVGDVFDNRDIFKQYLNDNAKRWHFYYVCRNSKKKIFEYNCICMAYNLKQREVVIRRQKKRTTACPCKIRLMIDEATQKVVVYYVCNHHDHPTTANAFYRYPHAKYLPQHVKEEFLDLTYLGLDVELIQKYIRSVVGLTIKKKDIWSYAYRFKRKIYQRSISDERRKSMEDLMTRIRASYVGSFGNIERPDEHTDLLEAEDRKKLNSMPLVNEDNTMISSSTENLIMNSQHILLKEVLGDNDNTEIIVQYVNEEGILCDENGLPVTNNCAIIQFINNYNVYVTEKDLEHNELSEQEACSEWNIGNNNNPANNEFESGKNASETILNEESDGRGESGCSEQDETVIASEKRLSPTPASSTVYPDMDSFRKYYHVDHRYIALDEQKRKPTTVRDKGVYHGSPSDSATGTTLPEYIKAPDFVTYPTSLRHCSGHDHLTVLTDADAILPGAKFLTHAAFLSYINQRASRWYFYYSLVESGRAPENYVYKCVYGKTRVSKNAYRAKGLRRRNKITTQCPCQIRLRRLEAEPAYLTVLYSCNHHDHDLDESHFTAQPHSRRLPDHIKEEVKDLITMRVSLDIIRKHVAAETGVRVYGKYFQNVRASMRARGEHRQHTERRRAELADKIRELEARYGNAAKENKSVPQNQAKKMIPAFQVQTEAQFAQMGLDNAGTHNTQEYCELSDKDDFAEEVCVVQADTLPVEYTAKQSRLETRLQNLSPKEILLKVKKLQESVRADGVKGDVHVFNA